MVRWPGIRAAMPDGARWPASFPGAGNPDPAPSGLLTKQSRDGAAGPGSQGFLEECPRPARGRVRGRLPCTGEGPLPEGHPLAWGGGWVIFYFLFVPRTSSPDTRVRITC